MLNATYPDFAAFFVVFFDGAFFVSFGAAGALVVVVFFRLVAG